MSLLNTSKHLDDALLKGMGVIASILLKLGLRPKDRIAIALPRGKEAAIAIYAVLSIGATYIPLDITNPDLRLQGILADAEVVLIIGLGGKKNWCPCDVKWLSFDDVRMQDGHKIGNFYNASDSDLAAILYTSGSSGIPKGVALSHGAMCCFADWAGEYFSVGEKDRIANLSPFYFDLSVFDLFTSLRFGASIHYMPNELPLSPIGMVKWLEENKITLWYTVPTVLTFLTLKGNLSKDSVPDLRKVLFAGEVFPTPHLLALARLLPHVEFYNLFGPTETNVCCCWAVDKEKIDPHSSIPIGYPACHDQIHVNSDGELLVKGPSLMSGYFSRGRILSPFDEKGWYHTGDRVSTGAEGELYYHGRLDRQLKCHGFRIEPGEVERAFYTYQNVEECVVFGIENHACTLLVACIGGQKAISLTDLLRHLKSKLPPYMVPERIVHMEVLPRLGNGKLNLQELKQKIKN